jgi:hypothetical protein
MAILVFAAGGLRFLFVSIGQPIRQDRIALMGIAGFRRIGMMIGSSP